MTNEIIVVYDDAGVSEAKSEKIQEQAEEVLDDAEAKVTEEVAESSDQQGTVVVAQIPEEQNMEETIDQIEADENVSFVQPNFVYSALGEVHPIDELLEEEERDPDTDDGNIIDIDDTEFKDEEAGDTEIIDADVEDQELEAKAITNDSIYNHYLRSNYLNATKTFEAWDYAKSQKKVTVAVLDSGCRLDHEDLQNNILKNYAYDSYYGRKLTVSSAPNGGDPTGHGTHVCGLIAAEANNGVGIAGTSYNANILPVKIFDNYGGGATTATFLKGLEYCRQLIEDGKVKNLRIINMSVGYY